MKISIEESRTGWLLTHKRQKLENVNN